MKLHNKKSLALLFAGWMAGTAAPAFAQNEAPLSRRIAYTESGAPSGKVYVRTSTNTPNSRLREVKAESVASPRILQPLPPRSQSVSESAPPPARIVPAATRIVRRQPESAPQPPAASPMIEPIQPDAAMHSGGGEHSVGVPCSPEYESYGGYEGDIGSWFSRGQGRWFAGLEFIMARPHFSEPIAFFVREGPIAGPGNVVRTTETFSYYTFDYEANARAYFGYRLDECCAELRGTYTRLDSGSARSDSANANATRVPTFFEIQPGPGQPLFAETEIGGDIFDLEFSRCLKTCPTCIEDPCDPCNAIACPAWDLQWSAGARLARWDYNTSVFTNDPANGRLDIDQEYVGAGPKVGLEGRRYFGRCGQFSVYSTFDAAILVGQFEHQLERNIPAIGVAPATTERIENVITRAVPVTEIEIGAKWQATQRASISAGWFFQAWWDLGMGTQSTSNVFGGLGPQFLLDDSNIMSWDGLNIRAEYTF